jgi:hypothetical protein
VCRWQKFVRVVLAEAEPDRCVPISWIFEWIRTFKSLRGRDADLSSHGGAFVARFKKRGD